MQKIAFENNLAETAFLVKQERFYDLRWFTPEVEVNLCGHATLASAFVLMNVLYKEMTKVEFKTKSGILTVLRDGDKYLMDFPSRKPVPCEIPPGLVEALGIDLLEAHLSEYLLVQAECEADVKRATPDIMKLKRAVTPPVILTAKGTECDFVSRFFAPNYGIDEDPVTGSSHRFH